jgi:hypothetical protein
MHSVQQALIAVTTGLAFVGLRGKADPPEPEKPFRNDLQKIAAEYKSWGRVDDDMRWAPWLCRTPNPGRAHVSASKDEQTHGQKLYSLFARNRDEYCQLAKGKTVNVGQAVVKQSWMPEEVADPAERADRRIDFAKVIDTLDAKPVRGTVEHDHFYPYARKGDKLFKATKQAELFIMLKLAPNTPDTDAGWVYATASADGKNLTSSGKVETCMKCHKNAGCERLFGLVRSP